MAKDVRRRVPNRAALRMGSQLVFDHTNPAERACAEYIRAAPHGHRTARIRDLVLLGHRAIRQRHTSTPVNED